MIKYKRKCPDCDDDISYTNKESYNRAIKHITKCKFCSNSGKNNAMYGKSRTDEDKQKISDSLKGEKHPMYGKTRPKHSEKMTGGNNPMFGKHHTEETKRKMKIRAENRNPDVNKKHSDWMKGENNPAKHPDVRKKLSEKIAGKNNPMYGKNRKRKWL